MKRSKYLSLLVVLLVGTLILVGCGGEEETVQDEVIEEPAHIATSEFEDGRYRGVFKDRGDDQVAVQIALEDNVVTDVTYRHLYHSGIDYRDLEEGDDLYPIVEQFEQVADYLEGEDIRESLPALYEPGDIVDDVDIASGATLRANKVISATRDALNRGVYAD
ncbi:hypothetical protein MWH28_07560 [Natroniella sulfidigena]|uniref:hypothetical protein n=1 Tax=Natroniella sulfidigena TaxID=723921 RepID=UPI00200A7B6A|nr:hypothetical protein [Natroniella sulfidigena]MCK8817215.1 hypothetical protein [Natroniella sulfidigena]